MTQEKPKHWSQKVTETSNARDLETGVFALDVILERAKDELRGLYGRAWRPG